MLTTVILPGKLPVVVGLNCTTRVIVWLGERVTGALPPVIVYPAPTRLICEIVTLEFPVLVIVTFCVGEEVPVVTFPKLRLWLAGLMLSVSVAAAAVPVRVTGVGEVGALLTIEMLPETVPARVGRKLTVMVVCWPAFTLNGSVNPLTLKAAPVTVT